MANAKKCDICGKLYEFYSVVSIDDGRTFVGSRIKFVSEDGVFCRGEDLCPECMTKVHTLLASIADEKEKQKYNV